MNTETSWNAASILGIVACLGAVAFYLYAPSAKIAPKTQVKVSDKALAQAQKSTDDAKALIDKKEWTQDAKALSGMVLAGLSSQAEKQKVSVTDLRFDRPIEVAGVKEAPFTVMVEGSFENVMGFVGGIESPDSKLGLSMLQFTTSDQGPGSVKATLRLTAFLRGEV